MPRKKENQEDHLDDGVVLTYSIEVVNNKKELVKLNGSVPIPLLLSEACIHQSEISFKQIFDTLVGDPIKVQMQSKIRKRQEDFTRKDQESKTTTSTSNRDDVFILADDKEEEKKEQQDDKQKKDDSSDTSPKGEQGDTKEKSEDGEWEIPDTTSG